MRPDLGELKPGEQEIAYFCSFCSLAAFAGLVRVANGSGKWVGKGRFLGEEGTRP
jgi:hypothetical protein